MDKPNTTISIPDAAALLFVNILWGSTYVVARGAMESMPPLVLVFTRFLLASVFMGMLGCHRTREPAAQKPDARVLWSLAAVGVVGFGLAKVLNYQGLVLSTATDAALIINLEPVFTAALAALLLAQRLAAVQTMGILVACAGGLALAWPADLGAIAGGRPAGNALMIASVAAEAVASVLGVLAMRRFTPLQVTAFATYLGTIAIAPFAWWQWRASGTGASWFAPGTLAAVAYLAVGATVLAYWLWYRALERVDAGRVAAFLYVQPVVGVVLGIGVRGEWPTWLGWTGGALVAAGLLLSSRAPTRAADAG